MILKKKYNFEKRVFQEKINFEKQILRKPLHKKSRFDPIYPVRCANFAFCVQFLKVRFWKLFPKSMILKVNFLLKSMILNEKSFL